MALVHISELSDEITNDLPSGTIAYDAETGARVRPMFGDRGRGRKMYFLHLPWDEEKRCATQAYNPYNAIENLNKRLAKELAQKSTK